MAPFDRPYSLRLTIVKYESSYLTINITVTFQCELEVTEGH